ncbi:MAG: GtrA family protein [Candidatus Peribacteria bacterium]|nr:GtrA family protein [Candidatus Peribacteria bacterium]
MCNIHYLISSVLAFIISVTFSFFFQKYFTFNDYQQKYFVQLCKFTLFQGGGQLVNLILLRLLVEKF